MFVTEDYVLNLTQVPIPQGVFMETYIHEFDAACSSEPPRVLKKIPVPMGDEGQKKNSKYYFCLIYD